MGFFFWGNDFGVKKKGLITFFFLGKIKALGISVEIFVE